MKNVNKYERQYFMPPVCEYDWAKKDHIEKAPIWCSVDLRDGNQKRRSEERYFYVNWFRGQLLRQNLFS